MIVDALEVCIGAATVARQAFSRARLSDAATIVGRGADGTPTTALDKYLELALVDYLRGARPKDVILSEEIGTIGELGSGDSAWLLDPLDGTTNAAMEFPYYAMSVAHVVNGRPTAGAIYNYVTTQTFAAARGRGATLDGRALHVARITALANSRVVLSKPFAPSEERPYLTVIRKARRVRMTGCPALDMAYVASGTFNAYIDLHDVAVLRGHDIAAGMILVEEAGGVIVDADNKIPALALDVTSTYNLLASATMELASDIRAVFGAA